MTQPGFDLDRLLREAADDTPPVPEDFHGRWTAAVRGEKKREDRPVLRASRWRGALATAAAFVFLIGGTFAYRASRKDMLSVSAPLHALPAMENTLPDGAVSEEDVFEEAEEAAAGEMDSAAEAVSGSADSAAEADAGAAFSGAEVGTMAAKSAAEAPVREGIADEDAAYEGAAYEGAAYEGAAYEIAADEADSSEAVAAGSTDALDAAGKGTVSFFADMGGFLLAVWPYLLIAAIPLAVAAILKKFRKKD